MKSSTPIAQALRNLGATSSSAIASNDDHLDSFRQQALSKSIEAPQWFIEAWDASIKVVGKVCNIPEVSTQEQSQVYDALRRLWDELQSVGTGLYEDDVVTEGTPSQVRDFLSARLKSAEGDVKLQRAILAGLVAKSYERMQTSGRIDPETLTDSLLEILKSIDQREDWVGVGYFGIIPYLRYILEFDIKKDPGWHQTLKNMAIRLTTTAERQHNRNLALRLRVLGMVYYWEVLVHAHSRLSDVAEGEDAEDVGVVANNMAVNLNEIIGNNPYHDDAAKQLRELRKKLRVLSLAADLTTTPPNIRPETKEVFDILELPVSDIPPERICAILSRLAMVAHDDKDDFVVAWYTVVSSIARLMQLRSRFVASPFFNAAVTINRMMSNTPAATTREVTVLRVALNGHGLYWALTINPTLKEALDYGEGFDCGVNMLRAVSDLQSPSPDVIEAARALFRMHRQEAEDNSNFRQNFPRMANAIRKLNIDPAAEPPLRATKEQWIEATAHLLDLLTAPVCGHSIKGDMSFSQSAAAVKAIFGAIANGVEYIKQGNERTISEITPYGESNDLRQRLAEICDKNFIQHGPFPIISLAGLVDEKKLGEWIAGSRREFPTIGEALRYSFGKINDPPK